jgi:superfamily II DNA or RNA helicase
MSIQLYPDQVKVLDDVRAAFRDGCKAPLLVAPTGFGKTVLFSYIASEAAKRGKRTMILVHRQELVDQVGETLNAFDVPHGIIAAGFTDRRDVAVRVASVFTLVRRLDRKPEADLLVVDEAHHATLRSTWGKVLAAYGGSRVLGVTATPCRLSGEGLGDIFDRLVHGPPVEQLVAMGRLSPVRVFAPPTIDTSSLHTRMGDFIASEMAAAVDKPTVTGDAIQHYQEITPGQRAAVFCVSLDHAAHIAAQAREAGIVAVQIDGGMDRFNRRQVVKDFKDGKIQWLVSCDLISEGFDCPGIEVGISLRPTQSLGLWLQQCGRCMRISSGKKNATILDHAGNSLRHGLPTETRDWRLDQSQQKTGKGEKGLSVRVCPKCWAAQRSGITACQSCGFTFPIEPRTIAAEKGTLEEITQEEIDRRRERQKQGTTRTLEQLTELGRIRNYRDPAAWARHVLAGRDKKRVGQ